MKPLKSLLSTILFVSCLSIGAQTPEYYDLDFEMDSTESTFKPIGKNYTIIRSKRGNSGVNKTPMADAILKSEITEIVLVYSEFNTTDMAEREEATQERWENLLKTYPELFQYSTTYKNVCQCHSTENPDLLKKTQGFYVYVNGNLPKINEPKEIEAPEEVETVVTKNKETIPVKEIPQPENKVEKAKEPVEKQKTIEPAKLQETASVNETEEEKKSEEAEETTKVKPKKKPALAKPRRSKDPKACRPPCYQNGEDDLNNFFKDHITLSKKQKRHGKNLTSMVRIQLNFDGTIKKTFVTGTDEVLNQEVLGAISSMGPWNAAVKSGVAVKSEVKITLKYDKQSKSIKPSDVMISPRPAPKCKCVSDEEIFGSSD
jgi:hypothetical protein